MNNGLYAYALPGYPDNTTTSATGSIRWTGGRIANTKLSCIALSIPLGTDFSAVIEDAVIDGSAVRSTGQFATSPINVGIWPGLSNQGLRKPSGAVRLSNLTVIDTVARPFLLVNSTSRDVRGEFTVENPKQCNASLSVPCDGCPSPESLSERDVAVSFRCEQGHAATITFADGERASFVDDSLIDTSLTSELEARQQPPDSDLGAMAPLVEADAPWEKNCQVGAYSSVHQDVPGGPVSLFYQLYCSAEPDTPMRYGADTVAMVAVAESIDGIAFTKPLVGKLAFRNSTRNNVVMLPPVSRYNTSSVTELEGCSVFRDPHSRRLTSVAALGTKLSVWVALDARGYDWTLKAQWEIGFDDSQSVMFWDRTRSEYSLYTRAKNGDTATEVSVVRGVRRLAIRSIDEPGLPVRKDEWNNDFGQTVLMPDAVDNSTHRVEEPACADRVVPGCTNQPTPVDFYGASIMLLANVTPPTFRECSNGL